MRVHFHIECEVGPDGFVRLAKLEGPLTHPQLAKAILACAMQGLELGQARAEEVHQSSTILKPPPLDPRKTVMPIRRY